MTAGQDGMRRTCGVACALVLLLWAGLAAAVPEDRQAWFGDLHLHTNFSFDSWGKYGHTIVTPEEAYRFARGEAVSYMGRMVRRDRPLDFIAVTDHAEYMGALNRLDDPNSAASRTSFGQKYRTNSREAFNVLVEANKRHTEVTDLARADALASTWAVEMAAANRYYVPGRFTTFIAYEWTSMWEGKFNLHRNVIFRDDHAPLPFIAQQSENPEDLWTYLEAARAAGLTVLAIPHNSNASGGLLFDGNTVFGKPIDRAYAERRARNEPLVEIYQGKGQSETVPDLSPADEFANFEIFDTLLMPGHVHSEYHGSYVREALGRGLAIERRAGANPFKPGFVGATDFHNGLSTSAENAYGGDTDGLDPAVNPLTVERAKIMLAPGSVMLGTDVLSKGSGGLTGAWAEANTRESIFAALQRRETFATSGTHIKVRLFAGWSFPAAMLTRPDWVARAYEGGVPMGSELARDQHGGRPRLAVWALKDPEGANLDRIQIVKVWLEGDTPRERVFDVAWAGRRKPDRSGKLVPVGNSVDLATTKWTNSIGAAELSTVWEDRQFDPRQSAVYYARVLEIPTPRWTTLLAVAHQLELPQGASPTIQERAWTSPVWYRP